MTSVHRGGFYGWPYSYFGAHTASLGLAYLPAGVLPPLSEGMVIGQHGSWNREPRSGYKVVFVRFADGRPVGVALDSTGALLVADDVGNVIWRVRDGSSADH